jgi:polyhydroxyalkanoate synthesis regulator phasin
MLRAQHRQQLIAVLEQSYFGLDNYSVEFPSNGTELARIAFIPDSRFTVDIRSPDNNGHYIMWECPAVEYVTRKPFVAKSLPGALARVEAWTERVKEEVVSTNPFSRELVKFREEIDRRLAGMQTDLDGFFSSTEAEELAARLEALEVQLKDLSGSHSELEEAVVSLSKTVADLQSGLTAVNRGTWYRMGAGRLLAGLKGFATSKEGREFALEAAKKFLLEGPK